ncbi:hypothetical protein Efla_000509 [Eimeria flavescens]
MTPYHFTGEALSRWGVLLMDAQEEVPKSWDDRKAVLLSRFRTTSTPARVAKLKRLELEGDLDAMAEEFAGILRHGESVPSAEAKGIFLSRLPYELAPRAFKTELKTWAQVKQHLRGELESEHELALASFAPPTAARSETSGEQDVNVFLSDDDEPAERPAQPAGRATGRVEREAAIPSQDPPTDCCGGCGRHPSRAASAGAAR